LNNGKSGWNRLKQESPEFVKISHATAISLGLMQGRMYRGAVNRCVNLLVHYPEGCSANCAYCGLAKKRPGAYEEKSFIQVSWPVYPLDKIIAAVNQAPSYVGRSCISMITNGKCLRDTLVMTERLSRETPLPVSILISPTLLEDRDLEEMRGAGADKIGVAIDLATPELFDLYRGKGVSGPHRWAKYWEILRAAVKVFGSPHVGAHLMVGMGETEEEMISLMDRLRQTGVMSHLFSFFAEKGSGMAERPQPPWPSYLRIQLARHLLEADLSRFGDMRFDPLGRLTHFGVEPELLERIIGSGLPFMTSGCLGEDGRVACNRPFGNCLPDIMQWNYPYPPNGEEIDLIRRNLFSFEETRSAPPASPRKTARK
jgi:lipoyl synthase